MMLCGLCAPLVSFALLSLAGGGCWLLEHVVQCSPALVDAAREVLVLDMLMLQRE